MNRLIRVTFLLLLSGCSVFRVSAQFDNNNLGYGAKLGINYSLSGAEHQDYVGDVMPTLGLFMSVRLNDHITLLGEPGYSAVTFRKKSSDVRYNFNYIDLALNSYIYPSSRSKDFAFVIGLRPSFLIAHSTEVFRTGSYQAVNDPSNNNKNGRPDLGITGGISMALSPVVELELTGNYSVTNSTTLGTISGRPSTVELAIRLNAVNMKSYFQKQQNITRELIQYYSKGVLLVMLTTSNPAEINTLKKEGRFAEIAMIENEHKQANTKIIKDFTAEFSFCPVYFFMDTSAYKVVSGNVNGIFVNNKLESDTSISIDTAHYFVASFCADISEYTHRETYGLHVYNDKIVQLGKPFNPNLIGPSLEGDPFNYIKKRRPNYSTVPFNRTISKLNSKLMKYMF